jgi:hypothetical protein
MAPKRRYWVLLLYFYLVTLTPTLSFQNITSATSTTTTKQDFGVALYFVVVTISTVGYGDYSPSSPEGRAVVCLMIIGFMVIVPVKISELAELLALRSPWHITYRAKVIVCCAN